MNVEEILAQLERNEGHLPQTALEEAAGHREEIIPRLVKVLEDVARDPEPYAADQNRMIHLYATYLLAQFRETRALPLLLKIVSGPGGTVRGLFGSMVTQDLGSILASVSDGDPAGMMALIENEEANEWVRGSAFDGLLALVACGLRSRDETMAYFARLFHTLDRKPSEVWNSLAVACADLCPAEVFVDLRQAYEDDLVDPGTMGWKEVPEAIKLGTEASLEYVRRQYRLITNAVDAMKWWACFKPDEERDEEPDEGSNVEPDLFEDARASLSPLAGPDPNLYFPETYHRTEPKIGRNQPCPCGSGKKYKKCCGR